MVFLARNGLCIKFTPFYSFLNKNQLIASPLLPAKWRLSFYLAYSNLFFVAIMIFFGCFFLIWESKLCKTASNFHRHELIWSLEVLPSEQGISPEPVQSLLSVCLWKSTCLNFVWVFSACVTSTAGLQYLDEGVEWNKWKYLLAQWVSPCSSTTWVGRITLLLWSRTSKLG